MYFSNDRRVETNEDPLQQENHNLKLALKQKNDQYHKL